MGGRLGHPRHDREAFPPAQIDKTRVYSLDCCPDGGGRLEPLEGQARVVQQVQIVPAPVTITEHRQTSYRCRHCGQALYARRSQRVEPFNDWFNRLFELDERVWHRGLDNNRTQMLAAVFGYQLLVRYNHPSGRNNGQIKRVLDQS